MSSCKSYGIVGQITRIRTPAIVQGADSSLEVQVYYKGDKTCPYKFVNFSGASAYFLGIDDTIVSTSASLASADLGKIAIDLPASTTLFLEVGDEQRFQVDFEDDVGLTKILFDGGLVVVSPLA